MTNPDQTATWVLDTNLLISRLLVPSGTAAKAVDHALERGILLVSEATLEELATVLARPSSTRTSAALTASDSFAFSVASPVSLP